ncbi:hypothetical protein [Aestuariirhabdus sp. LZHN29]|uniref:hypothetical protein n=1 Tax=Aestuariirhabdus sp. LZHN29 TaxID=3417462 RepID=UPI003CF09420
MRRFKSKAAALITMLLTMTVLAMPVSAREYAANSEDLKAGRMAAEIVVRPVSFAIALLGTAAFVVTLPFSAMGGNVGEAADTLVKGPFDATFKRCLGCVEDSY